MTKVTNFYVDSTSIYYRQISNSMVVDTNTTQIKRVDKSKYCILYESGVFALSSLNSAGIKVLQYIILNIEFNSNVIKIKQTKVAEDLKESQVNISRGIKNLIDAKFIEKLDDSFEYGINHNFFFKGDRRKLYDELTNLNK